MPNPDFCPFNACKSIVTGRIGGWYEQGTGRCLKPATFTYQDEDGDIHESQNPCQWLEHGRLGRQGKTCASKDGFVGFDDAGCPTYKTKPKKPSVTRAQRVQAKLKRERGWFGGDERTIASRGNPPDRDQDAGGQLDDAAGKDRGVER